MSLYISYDVAIYRVLPFLDEISLIRLTVLSRLFYDHIWGNALKGRKILIGGDGKFLRKEVCKISDSTTMKLLDNEVMSDSSFFAFIQKTDNSLYLFEREYSRTYKYVCENFVFKKVRLKTLKLHENYRYYNDCGSRRTVDKTPLIEPLRNILCMFDVLSRFVKLRFVLLDNRKEEKKRFFFIFTLLRLLKDSLPNKRVRHVSRRSIRLILVCIRKYLETLDDQADLERHLKEGLDLVFNCNIYDTHSLTRCLSLYRKVFRIRPNMYQIGLHQLLDYFLNNTKYQKVIGFDVRNYIIPQRWPEADEIFRYVYSKNEIARNLFLEDSGGNNGNCFRVACHFGAIDIVKFLVSENVSYEEILKNDYENMLDNISQYWTTCQNDNDRKQTIQLVIYLFDLLHASSSKSSSEKEQNNEEEGEGEEETVNPFFDLISSFENEKDGCKKCFYDACMTSGLNQRIQSFIQRESRIREAKIERFTEYCLKDILNQVKKGDHGIFCKYFMKSQFFLSFDEDASSKQTVDQQNNLQSDQDLQFTGRRRKVMDLQTNRFLMNLIPKFFNFKQTTNNTNSKYYSHNFRFSRLRASRLSLEEFVGSMLVRFLCEEEEDFRGVISIVKMMLENERYIENNSNSSIEKIEKSRRGHKKSLKTLLQRDDFRKILNGSLRSITGTSLCNELSEHVISLCSLKKDSDTQYYVSSSLASNFRSNDRNILNNNSRHAVMILFSVFLKDKDFVMNHEQFEKLVEIAEKVEPPMKKVIQDLRKCKKV